MPDFNGSASVTIPATPDAVFQAITDIERLPAWNGHIDHVVAPPAATPDGGEEWVIEMHVPSMGARWDSRSRLIARDPVARQFLYRSQSDDGNPSYADWQWDLEPATGGTQLTVRWDVHPETFWRRVLFSRIRRRQLAREVPKSLAALSTEVVRRSSDSRAQSASPGEAE